MNVSEVCPDDLLLCARQGELRLVDDAKLAYHLERCARCRAALEVGRAFDAALGARAGDDEIASAVAARLTQRRSKRGLAYALAAGVLLSGSLAGAAANRAAIERLLGVAEQPTQVQPRPVAIPALRATPTPETEAPPVDASPALEPAPTTKVARRATEPQVKAAGSSATELFREANALRSQGQSAEAQKRYGQLQAQFPGAPEARVSLVSLGRLELASKPAEALRHFNAYLTQAGNQTLAEEALFGRASALGRLGRGAAERAAWRELLARFPASVYAEHATTRLSDSP